MFWQDDLEAVYRSNAADAVDSYRRLTTRQKYVKNPDYKKFRENVWEVQHQDEAMPPLGNFILKGMLCSNKDIMRIDPFFVEDGDSDSESDIEVGGMTQTYKCPLTLTQ